jgi:hypothetical protein
MIKDFLQLPVPAMAVVILTLLAGVVFVVGFLTTVVHQYHSFKMLFALQRISPETFRYVTSIGGFGPWASNPLRFYRFLQGSDFDSDSVVGPLKAHCRTWTRRWLVCFAAFGVIFALDAVAMAILALTHHG